MRLLLSREPNLTVSTLETVSVIFIGWSPVTAVIRKNNRCRFFLRIKVHRVLEEIGLDGFLWVVVLLGVLREGGGREGWEKEEMSCPDNISLKRFSSLVFPRCFFLSCWGDNAQSWLYQPTPPPRTQARVRCLPPGAERTLALTPSPKLAPRLPV